MDFLRDTVAYVEQHGLNPDNWVKDVRIGDLEGEIKCESVCSMFTGWWMHDNHTFQRIDLTGDWREQVMQCFEQDSWGNFFVRRNNDTVFTAFGSGDRCKLEAELDQFDPEALFNA